MTKVYGTGAYDFKRHRVAEYPVELPSQQDDKPVESKPGSTLPSSITLSEIQRDRLTKIASENWLKTEKPFDAELVKEIYRTELTVKEGRKTVPLHRVMILEVSQYLENYLWPNFDAETASFEHVMSMILMVNEKVIYIFFNFKAGYIVISYSDVSFREFVFCKIFSFERMWQLGYAFMIERMYLGDSLRGFFV